MCLFYTIQYFIDTPLVGLFSDNATNNINILIKTNYIINVINDGDDFCLLHVFGDQFSI